MYQNRQLYNLKILDILKGVTPEMLDKVGFKGTVKDYKANEEEITDLAKNQPQLRFIQILFALDLYNSKEDRFYEESITTFHKLVE